MRGWTLSKSAIVFLSVLSSAGSPAMAADACSASKLAEVLEPARANYDPVVVDCNLTLKKTDVVSKVLDFYGPEASGTTLNCNGGLIDGTLSGTPTGREIINIRPRRTGSTWAPPVGVTITNCVIKGSARIWWGNHKNAGIDIPGEADDYEIRDSSRRADHTANMQKYAPRRIVFSNVTFKGNGGGNLLYIGPGVTDSSVINSTFSGEIVAGAIYLEAESARNTIKNNDFNVASEKREIISVDGSARNIIMNNRFTKLKMGGIFLYRNCGEYGVIRHQAPDYNVIVNNVFDYSTTPTVTAKKYGVYVSSRTGAEREGADNNYCPLDDGLPWGSSADDSSPARQNVIGGNRVIGRAVADTIMIANGWYNIDRENLRVTSAPARAAGCYVKDGSPDDFIASGQSVTAFNVGGKATCTGTKVSCTDGTASSSSFTCPVVKKDICSFEISTSNRLILRDVNSQALFGFSFAQVASANAKMKALIADKTCDASSRLYAAQKCTVILNGAGRYVVRLSANNQGLFYFSTKKEADAQLSELRTQKICL